MSSLTPLNHLPAWREASAGVTATAREEQVECANSGFAFGRMPGNNICIQQPCTIDGEQHLALGNHIHIGRHSEIMADNGITIGNNVVISYHCMLWSIDHRYEGDSLSYDKARIRRPIVIHNNVWSGRNVIVRGGVTIGDGCSGGDGQQNDLVRPDCLRQPQQHTQAALQKTSHPRDLIPDCPLGQKFTVGARFIERWKPNRAMNCAPTRVLGANGQSGIIRGALNTLRNL